jgi:hypothetical protein
MKCRQFGYKLPPVYAANTVQLFVVSGIEVNNFIAKISSKCKSVYLTLSHQDSPQA